MSKLKEFSINILIFWVSLFFVLSLTGTNDYQVFNFFTIQLIFLFCIKFGFEYNKKDAIRNDL
jgi:hypothetical protein